MGFGILFIGYFFLINPSYFQYTDIIGAAFMLLGLYKLSAFNRSFKRALMTEIPFFIFSAAELVLSLLEAFVSKGDISRVISYTGVLRYSLLLILTVFILCGIKEIAEEVDAAALLKRASSSIPLSFIFGVAAVLELPILSELDKTAGLIIGWIAFAVILAVVVYTLNVLIVIYRAYLEICMPSDAKRRSASGGGIMDKYFSHLEEKTKEYAEYKRQKRDSKNKRKK